MKKNYKRNNTLILLFSLSIVLAFLNYFPVKASRLPNKDYNDRESFMTLELGEIENNGISPFNATFGVKRYIPGSAWLRRIYWDFHNDGTIDATGNQVKYQVSAATDEIVRARIVVEFSR